MLWARCREATRHGWLTGASITVTGTTPMPDRQWEGDSFRKLESEACGMDNERATPSSTLAWKTPWTEKPSRLQSTGLQRVGHNWAQAHTRAHTHTHTHTQTHTHSLWRMGNLSGGQTSNLETHCGDPSQRVLGKIIEPTLNSVSFLQSLSNDFHLPNSMGKSISREPYI